MAARNPSRRTDSRISRIRRRQPFDLLLHLNALIEGSLRDPGDDRVASGLVGGGIGDEDGDRHAAAIGQRDQPNIIRRVSHTIPRIRRCPAYASRLFLMAVRL